LLHSKRSGATTALYGSKPTVQTGLRLQLRREKDDGLVPLVAGHYRPLLDQPKGKGFGKIPSSGEPLLVAKYVGTLTYFP
jgi:hypothetical protein